MEPREGAVELDAAALAGAMVAYLEALKTHRDVINRLNVFPVPDGDTGTNMALTLESVIAELDRATTGAGAEAAEAAGGGEPSSDAATRMALTCKAISHGSLMGARGNSGVILCQILRGMSSVFAKDWAVGPALMAEALMVANEGARSGVMRPVEGTILTVAAGAADAAEDEAANSGTTLAALLDAARGGAVEALHRTPELLPVLAAAGVVDAGGAGLVLLYDAMLHVVDGRPLPASLPLPPEVEEVVRSGMSMSGSVPGRQSVQTWTGATSGGAGASGTATAGGHAGDRSAAAAAAAEAVGELRYEVMYLLEAPDTAVPAFKEVWAGIGDSIVVVGGDGLWNCHIHTDDIGAAVEAALDAGRPRDIRVTDLAEQVEEELWVVSASEAADELPAEPSGPPPVTSVVAVATGDGIRRIFHSLGVHNVVAGGQSMNPSTAQILEVVEAVPADQVIVLPNNKNIFPVASQVLSLTEKRVRVVETGGIQEGFAALLEYDPEADADENAEAMSASASRVVAGEVTRAVRESESPVGQVATGDWIGLSRSGIESIAPSPSAAVCGLLARIMDDQHEIVTLIEGAGASAAETRRITEWLRAHRPEVAVERHHGGQPLYPYLVSVE